MTESLAGQPPAAMDVALGRVSALFIGPRAGYPMVGVDEVKAVEGRGLDGDRYASGEGTWSDRPGGGRHVTLVEQEAIDAVKRENGIDLAPGATRRNIVTTGVALNHLVDREFWVGDVRLRGIRLCEPCAYLAEKVGRPILQPLLHRAGLRAEIVSGGVIRAGDAVRVAR